MTKQDRRSSSPGSVVMLCWVKSSRDPDQKGSSFIFPCDFYNCSIITICSQQETERCTSRKNFKQMTCKLPLYRKVSWIFRWLPLNWPTLGQSSFTRISIHQALFTWISVVKILELSGFWALDFCKPNSQEISEHRIVLIESRHF